MKIGINLIPFSTVQGIEIFSKNIISQFLKLKKDEEFLIICSEDLPNLFNNLNVNCIKIKKLKSKLAKALYQQFNIYSLLKKNKIDILFAPSPLAAPFFYKNKVVVIHDCAYDRFREFENLFSRIYFKLMFYGAKWFSKKVITVSEFSKKELIELYKINPDKIEVIYEGVPEMEKVNEKEIQNILKKFRINKPYFFYIGNWRPRKNLPGLIKAFRLFLKETNEDFLLIIGGRKDYRFLNLEEEIKKNQLTGKVILTDTLTRKEVTALYKKAKALTFPSFYEGFGLPILEAQSLGIPVLTSNTSSLPEVAGKGALYVNPYKIEDIAEGMKKISFDQRLREDLIKKGYENIKRFSWEKSAKQLLNIFRSVIQESDSL